MMSFYIGTVKLKEINSDSVRNTTHVKKMGVALLLRKNISALMRGRGGCLIMYTKSVNLQIWCMDHTALLIPLTYVRRRVYSVIRDTVVGFTPAPGKMIQTSNRRTMSALRDGFILLRSEVHTQRAPNTVMMIPTIPGAHSHMQIVL